MTLAASVLRSSFAATNYCRRLALKHQVLQTCRCICSAKSYSTAAEVLATPHAEGMPKTYSPKIEKLVNEISHLTLLEVADLNELLKKTLNIQDAPMMAMSAVAPPAKQEEEEEAAAPKQEKVAFTVKLMKFDEAKKVQLIKEIKNLLPNMNLVQAKKFVESAPQVVQADISKEEAEKLKQALEAAGGLAEIE